MAERPAGRSSPSEIAAGIMAVRAEPLISTTLDRLEGLLAVVNERNEFVYVNKAFEELAGAGIQELCGKRPGEVFHCVNAREGPGGCGGSASCGFCGAMEAISHARETLLPATYECSITAAEGATAQDYMVRTVPFDIAGSRYILVSFREIGAQKRRAALERIFFHDILNTATSIKVHVDLLKAGLSDDGSRGLLMRLEAACDTLVEEIEGQKLLLSAENRTLTPQKNLIVSHTLAEQVAQPFEGQDISRGRKIVIAPFSESFSFVSDDSLVKRVLTNMLKNALEASPEGSTVGLGFRQEGARFSFWVHNSGCIDEQVRRQIFRRYFSTKGKDRGLGTYSIKLLTEEYLRGTVRLESTREGGTTFTITLPART